MSKDNISHGIYILSQADLDDREQKAFQRGVERGKLEERIAIGKAEVAIDCGHWKDGRCGTCGVQWQRYEVSGDFKCPHFTRRKTSPSFTATKSGGSAK